MKYIYFINYQYKLYKKGIKFNCYEDLFNNW